MNNNAGHADADNTTMTEPDRKVIVASITRMLARREHSAQEIVRKLSQKGVDEAAIWPVLDEFREAGIQSDARYAEARARALMLKGSGPQKIKADLHQHGVAEGLFDEVFRELDADWFELARQVKEKRFGQQYPQEYKDKMKQMQFLSYRGFSQSHINYAVNGE
ncbi:regulatory protein RecX [Alteromonas sp. H39]|uniref:regulatory protein RecX n=1 Tax=Alteromonas sp. H39 TaxID=3389876 RepID=UPI0039E11C02